MSVASLLTPLSCCLDVKSADYDSVVFVAACKENLPSGLDIVSQALADYAKVDCGKGTDPVLVVCASLPSKRLVFAPTGPVNRDYDDVRRFQDAALKGIKRAIKAGSKSPLVVCPGHKDYPLARKVAALGALEAAYTPIEVREMCPDKAKKLDRMGLWAPDKDSGELLVKELTALECGRLVARDIGGSDPERMAAPRVADYVEQALKNTCIKMKVVSELSVLEKEYPLLAAVNRSARLVPRHQARVIFLEYEGQGPIDQTLCLVGKGITYDTGGADIKAGGVMAGMHRDKCGAAAVAGFFQLLSVWKPAGLKVLGVLCMVRNSVGSECYVSDEIIVSRAGVRVRIGNTDAEGRMVMTDLLCHMKEQALKEVNPQLFTVATLTGHVIRAYGPDYTAVMDNGPARKANVAQNLFQAGEQSADPFEISTVRRDDFVFNSAPSEYEDVVQANNKPSTMTNRGHQVPAAFMTVASGMDKHGNDSEKPIKYTHMDVAGSSGPFPGIPTGSPIVALATAYVLNRKSSP